MYVGKSTRKFLPHYAGIIKSYIPKVMANQMHIRPPQARNEGPHCLGGPKNVKFDLGVR